MSADRLTIPQEVQPPPSPRKYWTRRGIAEWLVEKLSEGPPTLVGIDHGFSFPLQYFEQHGLPLDWPSFLDDFQRHWPTDEDIYVDFVRDGSSRKRCGPLRQSSLAAGDRTAGTYSQIRVPFRRAGVGGEVHARRHSVAALYPATTQRPRPFLAVRRLERAAQSLGGRGGLPCALEQNFPERRTNARPAGRLCDRQMVAGGRTVTAVSKNSSALSWNRTSARRLRLRAWILGVL